jgi:hypothetical protein
MQNFLHATCESKLVMGGLFYQFQQKCTYTDFIYTYIKYVLVP